MPSPVLIYNLFPLLAGPVSRWSEHLERLAGMGFTWIYLNPFHYPGFSGSLYAVKDYSRFHPLLAGDLGLDPFLLLRHFLDDARRRGLAVMMDLVVNHTAADAALVTEHPEWYAKDDDGAIKHPSCIDPADATKVTVWGDLAELEYWPPPDPEGLLTYFTGIMRHYLELGIAGFRCDAAYKIPGDFWARLIAAARQIYPETLFLAETLGCRLEELAQLEGAGFDFLYNSSKWWDFQAPWCLEQYAANRKIAPSISFAETHDTPRLITEAGGDQAVVRQRYLFAAFFSTGLLMPMGFEYGLPQSLNVKHTRPADWDEKKYDLTEFIARVNRLKLDCPVLLGEGPILRESPSGEPLVLLLKSAETGPGKVLAVINASARRQPRVVLQWRRLLGHPAPRGWELTGEDRREVPTGSHSLDLAPHDLRLFFFPDD